MRFVVGVFIGVCVLRVGFIDVFYLEKKLDVRFKGGVSKYCV